MLLLLLLLLLGHLHLLHELLLLLGSQILNIRRRSHGTDRKENVCYVEVQSVEGSTFHVLVGRGGAGSHVKSWEVLCGAY